MREKFTLFKAPASVLALFVVGAVSFQTMARQAPAFSDDLLIEGVVGNDRLPNLPAMYDHGSYLFQTGYGYLQANVLVLAGIAVDGDVVASRGEKAETLLLDSLRLDPANAHAWLAYAQAAATAGKIDQARRALVTSWQLAPTTPQIAATRLPLIEAIRTVIGEPTAHDEIRDADQGVLAYHRPQRSRG